MEPEEGSKGFCRRCRSSGGGAELSNTLLAALAIMLPGLSMAMADENTGRIDGGDRNRGVGGDGGFWGGRRPVTVRGRGDADLAWRWSRKEVIWWVRTTKTRR
jgi:hypothetical protein